MRTLRPPGQHNRRSAGAFSMAFTRMKVVATASALLLASLPIAAEAAVALTMLHSFSGQDGANPAGGLVQGADGAFYGTTSDNAFTTNYYGTIFSITADGTFNNLYQFSGGLDGARPQLGLLEGSDGNFYGTSVFGGLNGWGTVFQITPSGDLSTLADGDSTSGSPGSPLILGTDRNFYTLGNFGFGTGFGSVFSVTPAGDVTNLATLDGT